MAVATVDQSQTLAAQPEEVRAWYTSKYGPAQADLAFLRDRQARAAVQTLPSTPAGAATPTNVGTGDPGWGGFPAPAKANADPFLPPQPPDGTPALAGVGAAGPQKAIVQSLTGEPVVLFDGAQSNGTSDFAVDMRAYNAAHIDVIINGSNTPLVNVTLLGGIAFGATFVQLGSPLALLSGIASNKSWDVLCGAAFLKVQLSGIAGTFSGNQGVRVVITPYISPGPDAFLPPAQTFVLISAATTNLSLIKGSAAKVLGWYIANTNAAFRYVQLFNASSTAQVTLGTTTPTRSLGIPPNAAANVNLPAPLDYEQGIVLATTTTGNGAAGVAAGDLDINLDYV